jgi:hypothetical protein
MARYSDKKRSEKPVALLEEMTRVLDRQTHVLRVLAGKGVPGLEGVGTSLPKVKAVVQAAKDEAKSKESGERAPARAAAR